MQPEAALHVGREREGVQLKGVQGGTPDRSSNGLFLTDKGKQQVVTVKSVTVKSVTV